MKFLEMKKVVEIEVMGMLILVIHLIEPLDCCHVCSRYFGLIMLIFTFFIWPIGLDMWPIRLLQSTSYIEF